MTRFFHPLPSYRTATALGLGAVVSALSVFGCAESTGNEDSELTIAFRAVYGDEAFDCQRDARPWGEGGGALRSTDLRFYVHGVELLTDGGERVAAELVEDGRWQAQGVALLDFEDAQGNCENGTPSQNRTLRLRAPAGAYTGVVFRLGVPFEANHQDPSAAQGPLAFTAMHWSWNGGYKFLRWEASREGGAPTRLHLGSTGCEGTVGNISGCARPNRPVVRLEAFDWQRDEVILDLAPLLQGLDSSQASAGPSAGCMSDAEDPECPAMFEALGLDIASGEPAGAPTIFRTAPRQE